MRAMSQGDSVEAGAESLSAVARVFEAQSLALRTRVGVASDEFEDVTELVDAGLVVVDDGRVTLTVRGRLMANEVAARLREPLRVTAG